VPITLEIGQVSDTVEVHGGTPLLDPNTSTLGTALDTRSVNDLPLNGRNPLGLVNTIPTVRGIGYFGGAVVSTWRMGQVTIGGGSPMGNGFLIDGISNEKMTDYSGLSSVIGLIAIGQTRRLPCTFTASRRQSTIVPIHIPMGNRSTRADLLPQTIRFSRHLAGSRNISISRRLSNDGIVFDTTGMLPPQFPAQRIAASNTTKIADPPKLSNILVASVIPHGAFRRRTKSSGCPCRAIPSRRASNSRCSLVIPKTAIG
jgi:hypothetical protein